jgi:hypothetical protein
MSSLTKIESSGKTISKYTFFDKEGNVYSYIQVAEKIVKTIKNKHQEHDSQTIRFLLDEIANYICHNYQISTDRRQNVDQRTGYLIPFKTYKQAS